MSQEPLAMERGLLGKPTVETKMVLEWLVDNRWKPSHPHTPSSSRYRWTQVPVHRGKENKNVKYSIPDSPSFLLLG